MENSKDALRILSINAWRVSGARFNAVRRLRKRDWFSTFSIALFSAIALGIAATQKIFVFPPGAQIDNYLTALSAFIGLFVLVISLIEAGEQSLVKAERLETNANDLRNFMLKVNFRLAASADGEPLTYAEIDRLRQTYQEIIRSCPYNHAPMDDDLFVAKNRADPRWITKKLLSRLCEDDKTTSKPDIGKTKPKMTSIRAYWVLLISPLSGIGYFLLFWLVIAALITLTIQRY